MTATIDKPQRRKGRKGIDKPQRRTGNRVATVFGVTLILAGLGVLLYLAWQYFGTNIVAKQRQAEIKQSLVKDWGNGIDGDAIGLMRIKRFGSEVPIVPGGNLLGKVGNDALARGVAWYEKGAGPGEVGNFVVAGHRVTHGEPFRDFLKLRKGDSVVVETRTRVYTYILRGNGGDITVDLTVGWPLRPVPSPSAISAVPTKSVITLVTCAELFHTRNRNVVIGDLVSTETKTSKSNANSG